MNSTSHAGFAGYLLRAKLDPVPPRADGAAALVFDTRLRVLLHPAGRGDIVLESRVAALPDVQAHADDMLEGALAFAGRRPRAHADYLVLDERQSGLMLQQRIGADVSADEFESSLGHFLNALTAWRAQLGTL